METQERLNRINDARQRQQQRAVNEEHYYVLISSATYYYSRATTVIFKGRQRVTDRSTWTTRKRSVDFGFPSDHTRHAQRGDIPAVIAQNVNLAT